MAYFRLCLKNFVKQIMALRAQIQKLTLACCSQTIN